MFSPTTTQAIYANMPIEAGCPGIVVLPAEVYRELVAAARHWDDLRSGPQAFGATVRLVPQHDGSMRFEGA